MSYYNINDKKMDVIKEKGYNIKTKYIYGSRKAWRVASFINEIDEEEKVKRLTIGNEIYRIRCDYIAKVPINNELNKTKKKLKEINKISRNS